jgi:long-chain acyl-CoA synthetase
VPGSCGKAVHEVRIDSEDPAHVPGEIQARGANLTIGYYKNPEATAAAFTEDGWFRTGDMGIVDEAGNIFIRGRIKSMILSASGQNIYPEEVEAVLLSHPLVAEAIVVGRESKVVGLVYLDENAAREYPNRGLLAGQIRVDVNKQLPIYSQIALIELMDKPFEKTPKMSIKRYLYK